MKKGGNFYCYNGMLCVRFYAGAGGCCTDYNRLKLCNRYGLTTRVII
jgi:hypothetical protein